MANREVHFDVFMPVIFRIPLISKKIQQALPDLLGTHDFTSFCASGSSVEDKIRTIHEASVHVNETGMN